MRRKSVIGAVLGGLALTWQGRVLAQPPRPAAMVGTRGAVVTQDTLRDRLPDALAKIVRAHTVRDSSTAWAHARTLAAQYAAAHQDSFLIRQVSGFSYRTRKEQEARVAADSLRLAGNTSLDRDGVAQAMHLWRASIARASDADDQAALAPALVSIGAGFYRLHKLDSARSYVISGNAKATRIGDYRTSGNALGILASIYRDLGDTSKANDFYQAALRARIRSGDARGIAADENNLGLIARARGDYKRAARYFELALQINRRDGRESVAALDLANLAIVASDIGEYSKADSLFRTALSIRKANGDRAESAVVLAELGHLQVRLGNYAEATAMLREALEIDDQAGAVEEAAAIRGDLAELESATGHPEVALRVLDQAQRVAPASSLSFSTLARLALVRGDLNVQVGNLRNAESAYAWAESFFQRDNDAHGIANARYGRAAVLAMRGENKPALDLARESFRQLSDSRDSRDAGITELLVAAIQQSQGDGSEALHSLLDARRLFVDDGDRVGEAATNALLGEARLSSGEPLEAEAFFLRGLARLGGRPANDVVWRLHAGLADAMQMRGHREAASQEYRTAISGIEKAADGIGRREYRYGFLRDKWSVYVRLAMLEQSRGRTAEAFAVSERLRARKLIDMLARRRFEFSSDSRLESAARQSTAKRVQPVPVGAPTVTAFDVSSRLKTDEVFIEYLIGDSTSAAFVITDRTIHEVAVPVGHQQLAELIEFSRRTMENPNGSSSAALWRPPLERLYGLLISPIEEKGYLSGRRKIVIVPHGEIHFVPFAALIPPKRPSHFLVERFDIGYAPSATAWIEIGRRKSSKSATKVVAFAPQADRLPGARAEVRAIGGIYGQGSVIRTGSEATKRAFRAALPDARVLHLATYGVLNRRNPLFSFVKFAPEAGDDGKLDVNEVFGLPLNGQLVVLSACETALATGGEDDVPPGDDWIGLVHAFLQAGANTVLASLWPVDDAATASLMKRFHQSVAGGAAPSEALATAQRYALRDQRTNPPFFWAAFVLNGIQ